MGKNLHSSTRSSSFLEYSNKRSFGVIYSDRAKGIGTKYYKARGLFKSKKYGYIHSDVTERSISADYSFPVTFPAFLQWICSYPP